MTPHRTHKRIEVVVSVGHKDELLLLMLEDEILIKNFARANDKLTQKKYFGKNDKK